MAGATVPVILLASRSQKQEGATATITLSREGADAIGRLCSGRRETIDGTLNLASLDSPFVVIRAAPGSCQTKSSVGLRISSGQILGITRRPQPTP